MKVVGGIVVLAVVAGLVLLASERSKAPEGEGEFVLRGRLIDSATGREISRRTFNLHFFCDEIDHQLSLDPSPGSTFAVRLPEPTVRIRAADAHRAYRLLEQTVTIPGDDLEYDLRLEPTGFVRVHGKLIDGGTGEVIRPKPGIGNTPIVCLNTSDRWAKASSTPDTDGTYWMMVPRATMRILTLDTALGARDPEIDLTDVVGPEYERDIVLE